MAGEYEQMTYGWDAAANLVEDVTDIIYELVPLDTPVYMSIGDNKATGIEHTWQRRALTTRQHNALAEGYTYTFGTNRLPSRLRNINQILGKNIRVSESNQAVMHYAIADVYGDQAELKMKELKTDAEHAILVGTLASGFTDVARQMNGLITVISASNSTTYTDASGATFTESHLNDFIQRAWDCGGAPKDAFMGGRMKRKISSFTAGSTNYRYLSADEQRVINTISIYESDFFPVTTHLSRDIPNAAGGANFPGILLLDVEICKKSWLRRVKHEMTAKVASSKDGILEMEFTVEWGEIYGHYYATNVHVPTV